MYKTTNIIILSLIKYNRTILWEWYSGYITTCLHFYIDDILLHSYLIVKYT